MGRKKTGKNRRSKCLGCKKVMVWYQHAYQIKTGYQKRFCSRRCQCIWDGNWRIKYRVDKERLRQLYIVQNLSLREIERILGIREDGSGSFASYYVRRYGLRRPEPLTDNFRPTKDFQIDKVVTMYESGQSPYKIAAAFGCSRCYIKSLLVKRGVVLRDLRIHKSVNCNIPGCTRLAEKRPDKAHGGSYGAKCRFHRLLQRSQIRKDYKPKHAEIS